MLPKLFFISLLHSLIVTTHSSYTQCLHHQKTLLLQLKNELVFSSSFSTKLVQWNESDECCKWYGVECDAVGHVVSLQLDCESISGGFGDSSSLFRLEYLEKLNLAYNYFDYSASPIPRGIQNLTYLTHLNLSAAGFVGQVPAEISSLKRLVSLDISKSNDDFSLIEPLTQDGYLTIESLEIGSLKLEYPNLEMLLQNLTGLRELYLDFVNITSSRERRKWSHIVSSYLPHLTTLSFCGCDLSGPFSKSFWKLHSLSVLRLDYNDLSTKVPDFFTNFSSLKTLSLAGCGLKGSFPNMILQIPTLQILDLSANELLSGSIPPFAQNGSLKSIMLRGTNFSGLIPCSIGNLKTLFEIDLSHCRFTGSIPSTFANLTQLTYVLLSHNFFTGSLSSTLFEGLSNLVTLDLSGNSFFGYLPHSLLRLPSLQELDLSGNKFTGQVKEFTIVFASNLVTLDLSGNRLEGPIPSSLFQLQSLKYLSLPHNFFNGTFQLDKIQSLVNLTQLDLSYNNLSVDVGNDSSSTHGPSKVNVLRLASCGLNVFPDFIKHSDMIELDLTNNQIVGEIPNWIWGTQLESLNLSLNLLTDLQKPYHIPASLYNLDLHSNQLKGDLHLLLPPYSMQRLRSLLLGNNSFSGSIPTSLCTTTNLFALDLSMNKLSGKIPSCLLENNVIPVINLGRNNISGHIPDNFSLDCSLEYFDLSDNALEGKVPISFESCESLEFMNLGNNIINDTFPCMLPSTLRILVLHSNRFHGEVRCHNSWPNLQILDISSNKFSGDLESIHFSTWKAMVLDNDARLRYNHSYSRVLHSPEFYKVGVRITMKGSEMELVKIWPDFTAIDFSCNNFQGVIPNAIGDLGSLHLLNLSHNCLNGSIPKSFGQLRQLESLDISRNQITGVIPMELAKLTFLSFLNLSYNKLVGEIPNDRHLQTFSVDSFKGNAGLCGFNLNISCNPTYDDDDLSPPEHENVGGEKEIEWEYVSAALGYVVGLGSFVWLLLFCRSLRLKYFGKVEEVIEEIFDARDRRRRRARTRRVVRNQVRRQ